MKLLVLAPVFASAGSEADRKSKFVKLADEAFCIGPAAARESYLRGDVILEVAKKAGVDAIHPGVWTFKVCLGFRCVFVCGAGCCARCEKVLQATEQIAVSWTNMECTRVLGVGEGCV